MRHGKHDQVKWNFLRNNLSRGESFPPMFLHIDGRLSLNCFCRGDGGSVDFPIIRGGHRKINNES